MTAREVWRSAAHRLGLLALTVAAAAVLGGALVRMAPGFGVDERRFDLRLSAESVRAIEAERTGSFWETLAGMARGELGRSVALNRPVRELIGERAATTARTLAWGLALAWAAGFGAALTLEWLRRRVCEWAAAAATGLALSLPSAALALLFLYMGAGAALALGAILAPRIFRYARNALAASARLPHVLAARARGVGRSAVVWRHVTLPAAPELAALAGISVNMALGAAIPVEALCDSPGLGQLVWQAALARDFATLVSMTALVACVTALANLAADVGRAALAREA